MREPAAPLLPHSGRMMFLTAVTDYGENWLSGEAIVDEKQIFAEDGVLPAWAALEVMAQGIAALAGARARDAGEAVKPGFLLGTRKFRLSVPEIRLPAVLTVRVEESLIDASGLAVFSCELHQGDVPLCQANINVFCPSDVDQFIKEQNHG